MEVIVMESPAFYALLQEVLERIKSKEPEKAEKWIDTKEAMRKLGIKSKTTLQRLRDAGAIRFSIPMKKIIVYDAQSIDAYLEKHTKETF